jgi:hypothetical protein
MGGQGSLAYRLWDAECVRLTPPQAMPQFIDGSHTYEGVTEDLRNFQSLATRPKHILVLDDFGCVNFYCYNVRKAFYKEVRVTGGTWHRASLGTTVPPAPMPAAGWKRKGATHGGNKRTVLSPG